jgi:PAS domain S-box-containing protein
VEINRHFLQVIYADSADIMGNKFISLVREEEKAAFQTLLTDLPPNTITGFNTQIYNIHQEILQLKGKIVRDDDNLYYLVANITMLQEAPLARFRRFFDLSLLEMVVITNQDGKLVYSNKGFSDVLGYTWQEVQAVPLLHFVHQEDYEGSVAFFSSLIAREGISGESVMQCKHVSDSYKWILWRATFAKECFYAVGKDITAQKKQEIQITKLLNNTIELNQQLAAQNDELQTTLNELELRNLELDQFVYKVSHDLRAPLTSIMGLINLADVDKENAKTLFDYIKLIAASTQKLDRFIKSLLEYSRSNRTEIIPEKIDFTEIIQESLENLKYVNHYDRIEKLISIRDMEDFYTEPLKMSIIFNNIISNAIKYQNRYEDESYLKINISLEKNTQKALIIFEDNGIGIRQDYIQKVFDMFFRATEKADGSGLGLYIVKQAVERLKGSIDIQSEIGKYTRFVMRIPNLKYLLNNE